jgi:HlyD family secretion protein
MPEEGSNPLTRLARAGHEFWTMHPSLTMTKACGVAAPAEGPVPASAPLAKTPAPPAGRRRLGLWVTLGLLVGALVVLAVSHRSSAATQNSGEPLRTALVERRDFIRSVRVNGTVEAVAAHPISAPRIAGQSASTLVITSLVPTGTRVEPGDLLVEFDPQQQVRNALDKQAEYNDFVQQIHKLQATQAAARAADDTELKSAEDALATAELEVKRTEVESRIQIEKAQETLDESRTKLKQLQETYQLKRAADTAAVRVLEIQRDASQQAMLHAERNAQLMAIHAPVEGLVVLNTIFKNNGPGEVQVGDEVRPGIPFMQIVDPGAMRVRAHVNQQDLPGMATGERVEVRPDAYPDLLFGGHLEQIDAIGVVSNSSRDVHTFGMLFSIEGSNPKLLPDLSVAVDVELERIPQALIVPRDALVVEGGRMFARLLRGSGEQLRPVALGAMNEVEAVVVSGLQAGDKVRRDTAPEITSNRSSGTH